MMGRQRRDQGRLFYEFRLEDRIPENHLLRRMNVFVTVALADLHKELKAYYSDIGRPSVDPELMIRMLIVGYCYGIRSERKLCQEVELHLAYRWFCKLDLDDEVPHHSTFSENRLGRFRESDLLRHIFERVVWAAMAMGLVKGEGFAVDASVLEANASRYHGKAPDELDWTEQAAPDARGGRVSRRARRGGRARSRSQGAEGDLAVRSLIGLDRQGQQARAVRLWAQLPDRHRERRHRRRRGDAGPDLRRGRGHQDDARPHRSLLRSEAEAACRRHRLRHGQVPGLAGQGEEDRAAHPGLGAPQARGWHLLHAPTSAGTDGAASTSAPTGKLLQDQRHRARRHDQRYRASQGRLRCLPTRAQCCPKMPRAISARDVHEDARDVARRKMKTKAFLRSRDQRKRVEMRFAHLKTHHGFERLRLRGLSGARDEFHLAAIVQNLKTLALRLIRPPPEPACA